MTNSIEHLFMCLWFICVSSFVKRLFKSFAHFPKSGLSLYYWIANILYISSHQRMEGTWSAHWTEKASWERKARQAGLYNQWTRLLQGNLQGRVWIRWMVTQKHSQLYSTPPKGYWDGFVVNLGCGVGAWNRMCLPKLSLWMGNWSHLACSSP